MQEGNVLGLGRKDAKAENLVFLASIHQPDAVIEAYCAVNNAEEHYNALVAVIPGVKDKSLERGIDVAVRSGQPFNNGLKYFGDTQACLGRAFHGIRAVKADNVLYFFLDLFLMGGGQVDFVEDRDNFYILVHGQVDIAQGLGLDALGGIDYQKSPFACCQGPRYLVIEVNVAGSIQKIEFILLPVLSLVGNTHCLGLDGDAALTLYLHLVKVLFPGLAGTDNIGNAKDAVCQGRFAMVNVSDDAEVAYVLKVCHGGSLSNPCPESE